jgi:peptidoglycan/xylan/chitin deacetylase (PgdA/CDA1 family)
MLSRLEEAVTKTRDNHQRFPATASVAYTAGFLERPVVDEYVEMLWNIISNLDPSLIRVINQAKTFVTCDVDWPFDPIRYSLKRTLISSLADLIKRRSLKLMFGTWQRYVYRILSIKQDDNFRDSLNWMMDINEDAGNKVAFYFIPLNTSVLDSDFCFFSKKMRSIFKEIAERGHEIGLHPGYNCFNNPELFRKSAEILKRTLSEENINQAQIGGRMHYLRWDILTTPQLWDNNGFDYDSTLSFADKSGFRCGTSREFTMFDLVNRMPLKLKQRPLINMECTIISERYENFGYTNLTKPRFENFKKLCKKNNGIYTLLWHNSHFTNSEDKELYRELIK